MTSSILTACERLPGWELVAAGLADARAGRLSPEACLVWIAAPRLKAAGLLDDQSDAVPEPERALYALLCRQGGDAYPAYQALLRRLIRFEHALEPLIPAP